jgi:hypothetical protein
VAVAAVVVLAPAPARVVLAHVPVVVDNFIINYEYKYLAEVFLW